MAALGLAIGLWLLLPLWVAGQDLGRRQAGWLLGRPQGRGSVAASVTGAPLTLLLVAAGLAAAILTWRHRSGARSDSGPGAARLLALVATSAAGALGAIALGYPPSRPPLRRARRGRLPGGGPPEPWSSGSPGAAGWSPA